MVRHLVTGGAGFIGSHLAAALAARGDDVRVLDDHSTGRRENLAGLECGPPGSGAQVELIEGSVTDASACRAACEGVTWVFHEAAMVSVPRSIVDPQECYRVNVLGTLRMLEAARLCGVQRFVLAASSAAYGDSSTLPKVESMTPDPLSPYAAAKVAGEHLARVFGHVHGLRTVSLRYFNVFGPRQADDNPYTGVIALFARALLEGNRPTIFGDGEQTRDFTYVDDVVRANLCAAEAELSPGAVINVGGGKRISVKELFHTMAALLESDLQPIHAPPRSGDVRHSLAALDRAREWLGWRPSVELRAGLGATLDWYRERHRAEGA